MPALTGVAQQISVTRTTEGSGKAFRTLRDGSQVVVPWQQALVFEGRVFGIHAGSVTTPIAGHAAIDADQPEAAVYLAATGTAMIPIFITAAQETGGTTLATGSMMCAVSGINIAIGTSTVATPFNLKMVSVGVSVVAAAAVAYTGNGTDPLTAGNYLELQRITTQIDSDAATTGFMANRMEWNAVGGFLSPAVEDIGSILLYDEAAANTFFSTIIWAERGSAGFN